MKMLLRFRSIFLCGVFAISLTYVNGLSNEEMAAIRAIARPFMMMCAKENGVTEKDFKAASKAGTVLNLKPCFLSCILKKAGMFNSKGMLDKQVAITLAKLFLTDEKEQGLKVIETCAAVNDQPVSDGYKGCERAKLWVECYMPLKGNLPGIPF